MKKLHAVKNNQNLRALVLSTARQLGICKSDTSAHSMDEIEMSVAKIMRVIRHVRNASIDNEIT